MEDNLEYTEEGLIEAYIQHFKAPDDSEVREKTFWAWEELNSIPDALKCLDLVFRIIERANDPWITEVISAGKLQDLLRYAFEEVRDVFEEKADADPVIRHTLTMIHISKKGKSYNGLMKLVKKYNLEDQVIILD